MTTLIDNTSPRKEAAPGVQKSKAPNPTPSTPQSLYVKREQIYPKLAKGLFRNLKWLALVILLGIYYITPWIRWDRGPGQPDQAILIDFENARFYFFFIEIWPQAVYYITGLLILAALALFLVTALFGRVWCGYACPQTIWTDLFIYVERFFEGDRNARIKLNKAPWSASKIMKKMGKHSVWLLISALTGGVWILYFHDAPTVARDFFTGHAPMTSYVFAALLTFMTYALAGFMREQVCTYMCPWPRIQAAMIDQDALNVTYRYDRGEPRGSHKKNASWEGRGDCIDCRQCIAVCPVGIDIRDGLQLECIGCALCIDACNVIMDKIERPRGLIAYDTEVNVKARECGSSTRTRLIRPRTIIYAVLLAIVSAIMVAGLMGRSTLDINVLRDRQPNFVSLSDGSVRNGYTLKIMNKDTAPRTLEIGATGLPSPAIRIIGQTGVQVEVPADDTVSFRVLITENDLAALDNRVDYKVFVRDVITDTTSSASTVFVSGGAN